MNLFHFFQKTTTTILLSSLILLPVFFLPVTRDFYDTNKWAFFVCISLFTFLLWAGKLFASGKAHISWSGPVIGVGLVAASALLSLTFSSGNKIEALLSPLGPITWVSATILLLFGPTLLSNKEKIILRIGLTIAGGLSGLAVLYQQLGLASMVFPVGSPFVDPLFTPLGSPVALLTFLCLTLPVGIGIAHGAVKEQKDVIAAVSVVTSLLIILGIIVTLWKFIPVASSQMLPLPLGVQLMIRSWDNLPHLLFGVGPERFFEMFTLYRPQAVNMSHIWNVGFHANASLMLHIGSTMGLVGLFSFLAFCILLWKNWGKHPVTAIQAGLFVLLALFAPLSLVFVLTLICFIITTDSYASVQTHLSGIPRYGIALLIIVLCFISSSLLLRWHKGERLLFQSVQAAQDGNGSKTFLLIEEAVKTNPTNPSFHSALSQTSLLLADNLVRSATIEKDGKATLGNDDKTLLTNLVSRSIQEAKLAITLSPTNVEMWITIARVYQGLIGLAKDADTWAIAAYQKAISLDPTNPVLHLNLGGLYMSLDKKEDAGKEFIIAVKLKPNYIDGFYNLANVFRKMGDWDNAVKALEQTRGLIAKGSTDETKIQQEIMEILEEKKTKGAFQGPTSLYVPELQLPQ